MSGEKRLSGKFVLLRTGGLGDFVLVVPLLLALVRLGYQITVATRRSYFDILGGFNAKLAFLDVDEIMVSTDEASLHSTFREATVLSFWRDEDGSLKKRFEAFEVLRVIELESRPENPPHFTKRIFQKAGIQWEEDYLCRSWLSPRHLTGDSLWVHPGSGSLAKNAPPSWYLQRIEEWLRKGEGDSVVVSFGEADNKVEQEFREFRGHVPLKFLCPRTPLELKEELIKRAQLFVGNDTGPSHLAAALGIPTEVVFNVTNPLVWRPVGEKVKVLLGENLS